MSASRLQLGLFLAAQHPQGVEPAEAVRSHLEQVAHARELGFESLWAGQHFLSDPFQMFQTVPLLARMAAEAEGMTVGSAILLLTLLNPVEVAENAVALDAITGGRFVLGLGYGYRPVENAAFGVGRGRRELFEAKLDVVRRLLAGETVTAEADGFRLQDAQLSMLPVGPLPIWLAANNDVAVQRAARMSDAWIINPHTRLDELERQVGIFHAERAAAGLPALRGLPAMREVCVAETDERAMAIARPHLEGKYEAYVAWGQDEAMPGGDSLQQGWDALTGGGRFVLGSPETCARQIVELVTRLGVDHLVCRVQWPGMPQADALRTLRLLAEEVRPRVEAALSAPGSAAAEAGR
jgi:alkanesulfonate monooxygenase SsuD/methylene tetrahydromethanopterin reductase-like flavin-dependent oxidoreductase (luciferase family)